VIIRQAKANIHACHTIFTALHRGSKCKEGFDLQGSESEKNPSEIVQHFPETWNPIVKVRA